MATSNFFYEKGMPILSDLTGQRFGRLVVLHRAPNRKKRVFWTCRCDCGKKKRILAQSLRQKRTVSCGCHRAEGARKRRKTHGATKTPEYATWRHILSRCNNPNTAYYDCYGGRGIAVCERWTTFENFRSDMGPKPSEKHSIDRIDPDGDYSPDNCRWASPEVQQGNRRFCYRIHHNGKVFSLAALAREVGAERGKLHSRIKARGIKQKEFDSAILL